MNPGCVFLFVLLIATAAPARAQVYVGGDAPHGGSIEASGGGSFMRGFEMGGRTAQLTRSTPTERFDLFDTESDVSAFSGAYARLGYYLTRAVSIEGGLRFAKPRLSTRLSGDAESAADETAIETASHYVFDGSILFHLTSLSFAGGRGTPFVSGGAGYLRELHEGNGLVETGREYHATAGIEYWLGGGDHRFGLRFEAGLSARQDGFDDGDARRTLPLALAGLSYLF